MNPTPGGASAVPDWPADLLPPPFADGVRPAQLDVLAPLLREPAPGLDVVLLLDGLGSELLAAHRSLTPVLRRLEDRITPIRTVFPATTATAMVSLLTGLLPLTHGVLGYTTHDPATHTALNQLTGDPRVRPEAWMPEPTPQEDGARRAIQVAPARHRGSHLSRVAYRGWDFQPHGRHDRADAVVIAARRAGPDGLVHLHVDDVDHAGHVHGVASDAWRDALAEVDALIGTLLRRLPAGTRLTVTADHGMVDTDPAVTVDLAAHPRLAAQVAVVAGEARALALTLHDSAYAPGLAAGLRELLGERALVLQREQALAAGLWAPPGTPLDPRVAARLPEVLVLGRGRHTVDDYSRRPEGARRMVGVHGSLTPAEGWVPLLRVDT